MFTRRVVFQFKADSSAEFTRVVGGDVLPLLNAQSGRRHEDIETFHISNSTFHLLAANRRDAYRSSHLGRG